MKIEMCDEFYYRIHNDDIYKLFNTSKDNVLRNNKHINHYCGEWVKIKLNDFKIHIVKPMETIKSIANEFGVQENELIEKNNLKTDKLFIGQTLKIYNRNNK